MRTTRKTRIWGGITIALALTALVGCAQQYTPNGSPVSAVEVTLKDGRTVACVIGGNGVDCDWEGAR